MLEPVVTRIRSTLYDPAGTRWSDSMILYMINQALKDIARNTSYFKKTLKFKLNAGQDTYKLPDDVLQPTRVLLNDCDLEVTTHSQLDDCTSCWETKQGLPTVALFDKTDRRILRILPSLQYEEATTIINTAGEFGLYTNVIGISDIDIIELDTYGTVTGASVGTNVVTVNYNAYHAEILDLNEQIHDISDLETAIKYYVCGHLLRDDRDAQSRQTAVDELSLYNTELHKIVTDTVVSFNSATQYEIPYRKY